MEMTKKMVMMIWIVKVIVAKKKNQTEKMLLLRSQRKKSLETFLLVNPKMENLTKRKRVARRQRRQPKKSIDYREVSLGELWVLHVHNVHNRKRSREVLD